MEKNEKWKKEEKNTIKRQSVNPILRAMRAGALRQTINFVGPKLVINRKPLRQFQDIAMYERLWSNLTQLPPASNLFEARLMHCDFLKHIPQFSVMAFQWQTLRKILKRKKVGKNKPHK